MVNFKDGLVTEETGSSTQPLLGSITNENVKGAHYSGCRNSRESNHSLVVLDCSLHSATAIVDNNHKMYFQNIILRLVVCPLSLISIVYVRQSSVF